MMNPFETEADAYDRWFERHDAAYRSELAAVRAALGAASGEGLEIGAGTGRFAVPLGIHEGVEPAAAMRALAEQRGLSLKNAAAEALPYADGRFDFALMIATLCFVADPQQACREAMRVLRPGSRLLVGMVPSDSFLGRIYEARRSTSRFYRTARFFTVEETEGLLRIAGFDRMTCVQTLFHSPERMNRPDPVRPGCGRGGFVVLTGIKNGGGV